MNEYIYATQGKPVQDEDGTISLPREEVVRCMNCGYLVLNTETFHRCWRLGHNVYDLRKFCAWGERKGERT